MPNFEFKKDRVFGHGRNLALNSIVIGGRMTGRKDFVLWYLRQFGESACGAIIVTRVVLNTIRCTVFSRFSFYFFAADLINFVFTSCTVFIFVGAILFRKGSC